LVAFDADGTLWKDDVGTLTFDYALAHNSLRPEALSGLLGLLHAVELPSPHLSDANQLARYIDRLHQIGRISEKAMAELQVWCYAGATAPSAQELAVRALASQNRTHLVNRGIESLLYRARELGAEVWIVSASPHWVVASAAQALGVPPENIIAGLARVEAEVLLPELGSPLPYGPEKLNALRRARPRGRLVAAFGDSSFDLDLIQAAELAVGVGSKAGLLDGLRRLPHGLRLVDP
jgi:phosphatidylglycerophosphatase C